MNKMVQSHLWVKGKASPQPVSTAVIVAAGKGSRLSLDQETPKPLVPIVGVPLIARVMANAAKAGIGRFVIVIGYRADQMLKELPLLVPKYCRLEMIENPRFEEPNGVSLLTAAQKLQEPFTLLMADHLFSPERLQRAISQFANHRKSLLVVEDKQDFTGDLEDATLVTIKKGEIQAIGKTLSSYDAIDTGMFVLRPEEITTALRNAGSAPSISDAMRLLAAAGQLEALKIRDGFWQDIDTPEDLRKGEQKLYRSLTKATDAPLARAINRRVSLFLTARLWRVGVTPNMVTVVTLLLGLSAGVAFAQGGGVGWGLLGATLFQLHSIIDGVDGELARLLHKESRFGFWFDISVDNISHMAVFGGIALGQMADQVPGPWGWLGLIAVLGVVSSFAVLAPLLNPAAKKVSWHHEDGKLKNLIDGLSRRDFSYLLFPLAALGWLGIFLWIAAIGTWLYTATVLFLRAKLRAAVRH